MNDRNLARGLALTGIALAFGLGALRYPLGDFASAGPGLFPLLVSSLLLLIGIATLIRSFLVEREAIEFNYRNIGVIIVSLVGFSLISEYVNMIAGIVFMVFFASLAASSYSMVRNIKIAAGLVIVALAFQKGLGLQLPLY